MGKPETTDRKAEEVTFVRLVRNLLVSIVSAIDAATDTVDGCAKEKVGADAMMRELSMRLHLAGKDLGIPLDEGNTSSKGRSVLYLDPRSTLDYGHTMSFRTNDVVLLVAPDWYGDKYLKLSSACGPIALGTMVDFLLLRALALYAIKNPGQYMRMTDLLDDLTSQSEGVTTHLGNSLSKGLSETVIWKSLHRLRNKICDAGGRGEIIETAPTYNGGFRLSTPPWNIILVDPTSDGGLSE